MAYTLERFAADCRLALERDPGPPGREEVRRFVSRACLDADFVAAHLGPDNDSPRKVLHEDERLGFCILAHVHHGASESRPHDHGPSWAIYGQAAGVTEMTEWRVVSPATDGERGKVEATRVYSMHRETPRSTRRASSTRRAAKARPASSGSRGGTSTGCPGTTTTRPDRWAVGP